MSADPLLSGLNAAQLEAARHTEGPLLVLAGAGSGKTRVITTRIAYLIREGLARPEEILAVTFTNKAANEMRERVAKLTGKEQAKLVTMSTFHSFCVRLLREHADRVGYRTNFTISSDGDIRTLIRRVLGDMEGVQETFSPQTFQAEISLVKGTAGTLPEADGEENATRKKYLEWLPEIYDRYQSALRAANTLDFDDLLLLTMRLWNEHADVLEQHRSKYRYVMVDEYQDTNHVQYKLVHALTSEHRRVCVVGDDDQSIYGWRGADVRNILSFEKDFPEVKIVTLDRNYRSTGTILDAANGVIANNKERRPKSMKTGADYGRPIDWLVTGDEEHEAKMAVQWLEMIQQKTGAGYSQFAILYRSNTQSRPFEIAFRGAGIPYAVYGGQDFFDRAEVRDLVAYLKLLSNPRDEASFLRVVNMPRRGIGDATLHVVHDICRERGLSFGKAMAEALKEGKITGQAEKGVRGFLALLQDFRERFRQGSTTLDNLTRDLLDAVGYKDEVQRTSKTNEHAAVRWENLEAIMKSMAEYEAANDAPTLRGFLDDASLNSGDDRGSRSERRQSGVSLMTIHSAKGLEFPFVFLVGVEDGLLPHEKNNLGPLLEEERRLFYVALTRAQRHITLFEAISRTRHGKERMGTTSRFISEIPAELIKKRVMAVREMVEERVEPNKSVKIKKPKRRPAKKKG